MPYYQFKCNHCKKDFEFKLSMSEVGTKKEKCPKCNKVLKRIYNFSAQTNKSNSHAIPSCATGSCPFAR